MNEIKMDYDKGKCDLTIMYNTAEYEDLDNFERLSLLLSNTFYVSARDIGYKVTKEGIFDYILSMFGD